MNTRKLAMVGALSLLLTIGSLAFSVDVHASGVSQASFTTTWYDNHVFNIRVNSVRDSIQVFYDDTNYVTNGNCDDHRIWNAATGWTEDAWNLACTGVEGVSGDSATYARYKNTVFPGCGNPLFPAYESTIAIMPMPRRIKRAGI